MVDFSTMLAGFSDALTLTNLLFVIIGVVTGQIVGAIPGIGPVMAMAIAIPFTFVLSPLAAISLLIGINKGGLVGGAIPAIMINTPGTPDAAATALDGFPLAKQGKPLKATKMALYASITGDTFSDIILITISAPLAIIALGMGPVEVFCLMIFSFAVISGLVGESMIKGLISVALGFLFATVGLDPEHSTPRLFFGYFELYDGFPLVSVAIGMLAVAEIFRRLASMQGTVLPTIVFPKNQSKADQSISWKEYWPCRLTLLRGTAIGTVLGAIPGIGSTAAAFISYAAAKQGSKSAETFGKGNLEGIAATESANSAVMGANLIPLLTLGIPGSVSAALLISAFMIQGIQPGPLLFEEQGQLIYGLFGAMLIANFTNLWVGLLGMRAWAKVVSAPESVIFSAAFLLCIVGVYLSTGDVFGVIIMFIFALLGFFMTAFGYSPVIFIIAFFLEPRFEISLVQTMATLNGEWGNLLDFPLGVALLCLAVFCVYWLGIRPKKKTDKTSSYN